MHVNNYKLKMPSTFTLLGCWCQTGAQLDQSEEEVRSLFAGLVNVDANSIALAPSTSHAVSMAAKNIKLQSPKNCVLVMENQMGSNVMPWQDAAAEAGGCVIVASGKGWTWKQEILR